jgi:hypothetical protein
MPESHPQVYMTLIHPRPPLYSFACFTYLSNNSMAWGNSYKSPPLSTLDSGSLTALAHNQEPNPHPILTFSSLTHTTAHQLVRH